LHADLDVSGLRAETVETRERERNRNREREGERRGEKTDGVKVEGEEQIAYRVFTAAF